MNWADLKSLKSKILIKIDEHTIKWANKYKRFSKVDDKYGTTKHSTHVFNY